MPLDLTHLRTLAEEAKLAEKKSSQKGADQLVAFSDATSPTTVLALLDLIARQRVALTIIHDSLPTESVLRLMAQRALSQGEAG